MKKGKLGKFTVISLAFLLVTVACVAMAAPPAKFSGKVINWATFLSYGGIDKLRAIVNEWEKETGAKVNIIILPHPGLAEKVFMDYRAGINTYDLVTLNYPKLGQFAEAGVLEPLDGFVRNANARKAETDDFIPYLLDTYGRWENKLYGFPLKADGRLFLYRKDVFSKYGKKVPRTWDEYLELAKFFNGKDWNGDGKPEYGCAVRFESDVVAGGRFAEIMAGHGGQLIDSKYQPHLNSPEAIAAMDKVIELLKYAPKDTLAYGFTEYNNAYLLGHIPMIPTWSEVAATAEDPTKSKVVGLTGYAAIPGSKALLGGFGISMLATSKNKEAGYDFMTWFTSKSVEQKRVAQKGTFIYEPGRISTYSDPKLVKKYPWFPMLKENLANGVALPRIPESDEMIQVFGQSIRRAAVDDITSKEALEFAQDKWLQILKKAGRIK
jgi:multiple sugar transport system substrate-binding protein